MVSVFAATATELAELQPIRRSLLILCRDVVATLTVGTLKHNIVSRHNRISNFRLLIAKLFLPQCLQPAFGTWQSTIPYSITSDTVPAPTVRPPSRMAKRKPFSIAIGAINSISIATLSPGITISTPCGSVATPVTSVVRK
jgi:hypothetical protein